MTTKVRNAANSKTTSKNEVLNNCVAILNRSLSRGIAVSVSSTDLGFGKNYLSNVKMGLQDRIACGSFSKKDAAEFTRLYKTYQKAVLSA